MILTVAALVFSVVALVLTAVGLVRTKQTWMHLANAERGLAALARRHGNLDLAADWEARADEHARLAWPFTPRPAAAFEVPGGIVSFDQAVSDEEVAAFVERWSRNQTIVNDPWRVRRLDRPRRRWFQRRRNRDHR